MARSQFFRPYNARDYPWYNPGPNEDFTNKSCLFKDMTPEKTRYHIHPEWASENYVSPPKKLPRKYRPWNYEFHGARNYKEEPPYCGRPPASGIPITKQEEVLMDPHYARMYIKQNAAPWDRPSEYQPYGEQVACPTTSYETSVGGGGYNIEPRVMRDPQYQSSYDQQYNRCFPCLPGSTPKKTGIPIHRRRPPNLNNNGKKYMNFANIQWKSSDL